MYQQWSISVDELRDRLDRHERLTVLDVRPEPERREWAIPGSLHVDAYESLRAGDPDALAEIAPALTAPVVTVCGAGKMSLVAAEQLRRHGVTAISLAGGMKAWSLAWNLAAMSVPGSRATVIQVRRTGKGCLSYLVGSDSTALVIDAALDPEVYQDLARRHDWTISHVLDTHVHADHLSRTRRLAERTGAVLWLPMQNRVTYPHRALGDGDTIRFGSARLTALRTPGHTEESTCYQLDDVAVFTGDTLFLAGVGRPDLDARPDEARRRAQLLYGSLRRLATLPPDSLVLPGHTEKPVPFDGQAIAASLRDVVAMVKFLGITEDAFADAILARIPPTPPNHRRIVALNEAGEFPTTNPIDLEAGANRCAVS